MRLTNSNSHIEDFLDYFCNLEYQPEYAILIKGAWGAGKTWFIKRYCEKLKGLNKKYLYVSLYGMSNTKEIEDSFFLQLHPILSSKGMAITGKILKGALKATLRIDLDHDSKEDVTLDSTIPDLNIPDYLKNTDNCILFFDDLERCSLKIESILGYINHFVEHQGLKVIIIANEDQISKNENEEPETEKGYKKIKEKLIGKTFKVVPEIDTALNDFIDKVIDKSTRAFLRKNKSFVKEIYLIANYENLRLLKQALWDFERLYKTLGKVIKKKDEIIKNLMKLFLAFSFEIRHGKILATEIGKIKTEYLSMLVSKEGDKTTITEIIEKYNFLELYDILLTEKCWIDILDKGIIDKKSIEESLLKSKYFQDENTQDWVKLWHYYNLTDEEFDTLLLQVENRFINNEYKEIGVIKHVAGLLLRFSDVGLLDKNKASILKAAKDVIDFLKANKQLNKIQVSLDLDAYGGLGFAGNDLAEFRLFVDYIEEKVSEVEIANMPDAGTKLLEIMTSDISRFSRMICLSNSSDQLYYEIPIFKYIDPIKFIDSYLSINPADKRTAIFAFDKRFEFDEINKKLLEELEWLRKVREIMVEEQQKRSKKLSGFILKSDIENFMDKFIKKLESTSKITKEEVNIVEGERCP
jgi:hypothetical protein